MTQRGARDSIKSLLRGALGRTASEPVGAGAPAAAAENPNHRHAPVGLGAAAEPLLPPDARELFNRHECRGGEYAWNAGAGDDTRRIALLGGVELLRELAFDASVVVPDAHDWEQTLVPGRLSWLLVETAWQLAGAGWNYGLVSDGAGRDEVERLLRHCRQIGLPVVVWFREDVANYERFAWLAGHADRAYAVDEAIVQRLRADFPAVPAAHLPVAIQPAVHNPLRPESVDSEALSLDGSVLFDGWWDLVAGSKDHPLLQAFLDQELVVAESEWEYSNIQREDLPDFGVRAIGSLLPAERLAIGKFCAAEVFLEHSINKPWRDAQRILRSAAAGCLPVQPGAGDSLVDGIDLPARGDSDSLQSMLRSWLADPVQRARRSHQTLRALLAGHCLAHRLERIEQDLGIASDRAADGQLHPRVACILVTRRPELLPACLAWFDREHYPSKELIVVVHGDHGHGQALDQYAGTGGNIRLLTMGAEHSLGECLNFAISQSDAPYWAKIDDDDLYGDHYLSDLMSYRAIRDFDLIGKPPQFLYLESGDELRWDQAWHDHSWLLHAADGPRAVQVAGGTLLGRRETWDEVRFSRRRRAGSDSEFILRCYEHGHDLMVADGFNFARFRSASQGFHTWKVEDEELRTRSLRVGGRDSVPGIVFA